MPPSLKRLYDLPGLTTAKTQLAGAYTVFDVPLGPVASGYKTMRCTPEELVEYLGAQGLLSLYNAAPSLRKAVEYRTIAERTASNVSLPDSSTMEELSDLSLCLGTEIYVASDPDAHHEYKVVYDFNGPLLVWVDGNFSQSPRGRIQATIVPNSLISRIDVAASAAAGVQVAIVNDLLVFSLSATPPSQPLAVAVDAQRQVTLSNLPTGSTAADYEYQFRPGPTVSAARQVDLSPTLAAGESPTDYEYQSR